MYARAHTHIHIHSLVVVVVVMLYIHIVVSLLKGHAFKSSMFALTLIKILPCHVLPEVTILCSESVFLGDSG